MKNLNRKNYRILHGHVTWISSNFGLRYLLVNQISLKYSFEFKSKVGKAPNNY